MCLNPAECSFTVQAGKFLGFMISPTNVREMQQLMGHLAALSCLLSCVGDKAFLLFTSLKNKEMFEWTGEFEEGLSRINTFLTSLSIPTYPKEWSPLLLYLKFTYQTMSLVLVQETDKVERFVYFVRKMFKYAEVCCIKIEKLAMVVAITTRKLWPYFQGHKVIVKSNCPI